MVSLKDLKPKTHEGTGLRAHETKGGKKKAQPIQNQKQRESSERTGPGYLEAARGSGSSGHVTQLKWD